ncbi:MAG: hypothetical protein EPN82_03965 [Bacteroidetes bacterium]|nr:MAG: hypothetical protein EPN82_03965 [Bacteroidota bacterium]
MPKIFIIFLSYVLILTGCGTTKIIDKNPPPYLPKVNITNNNGNAQFIFTLQANKSEPQDKFDFINAITIVKLEIVSPEDTIIHTIDFGQLDIKGTTDKETQTSLAISGYSNWFLPEKINLEELKYRFKIFANNKFYDMTKTYSQLYNEEEVEQPALTLEPFIENQTYNSAVFGVKATRNKIVENEYIPTSETFRVDILNRKGAIVWSSGYGQNFLQVINPVLPKSKGETHKYTVEWYGNSSNQIPLIPGEYTLRMTIPAKPNSYTSTMNFKWKLNDDNK